MGWHEDFWDEPSPEGFDYDEWVNEGRDEEGHFYDDLDDEWDDEDAYYDRQGFEDERNYWS